MLSLLTRSRASRFWTWFAERQDRLAGLLAETGATGATTPALVTFLDELTAALARYDDRIFPFCGIAADGVCELIFTAEGNAAAFPSVHRLVAAAPRDARWRFIPLKPRQVVSGPIAGTKARLDTDTIRYYLNLEGDKPFILLLTPDLDTAHFEEAQFLGAMLLDSMLGEEDFARYVAGVAVVTLERFEQTWGHAGEPFANLLAEFDRIKLQ